MLLDRKSSNGYLVDQSRPRVDVESQSFLLAACSEFRIHFKVSRRTAQRMVEHLYCSSNVAPTTNTNISTRAARSDLVVIRHIDIEHELSLLRPQCGSLHRLPISWLCIARQQH